MFETFKNFKAQEFFKGLALSVAAGLVVGTAAALFLWLLAGATATRLSHPEIIWFLPVAGFAIGWVYFKYGKDIAGGNNLILQEIHAPETVVPLRMAPLVFAGTLVTHLFGGSAGREGTVVQMGASLADQLARPFRVSAVQRRMLLVAGAGAGFGAAVGAPWAGAIFGMEMLHVGRTKFFAPLECLLASLVAYGVTRLLHAPHSVFPAAVLPSLSWWALFAVLIAGVGSGMVARTFVRLTHFFESLQKRFIHYPPLKPFVGGVILVLLYAWEGSYRFAGLGIETIQSAFVQVSSASDSLLKGLFTAITISTGFKGGEFVPLVFVGSTLGSALAGVMGLPVSFLTSLGFAAVFAGASNTPLACAVMAAELFGLEIAPFALLACYLSYLCSGPVGIYLAQKRVLRGRN